MLLLTPTSTTNTEDQVFICHLAYCTSVLTGFFPNLASRTFFFSVHKSIKNINQLLLLTCLKVFCWLFISLQISPQLAKRGLHNPASSAPCLVPPHLDFLAQYILRHCSLSYSRNILCTFSAWKVHALFVPECLILNLFRTRPCVASSRESLPAVCKKNRHPIHVLYLWVLLLFSYWDLSWFGICLCKFVSIDW